MSVSKVANHNIFKDLTDEILYVCGFLHTDGSISAENQLSVELNIKDKDHLFKIRDIMTSSNKVSNKDKYDKRTKKIYYSARFSFRSKNIAEDLKELGIVPNKTFIGVPGEKLIYRRDFWRGAIDGDGCIKDRNSGFKFDGHQYSISLCGNIQTVFYFRQFIYDKLRIRCHEPYQSKNIWVVNISGLDAVGVMFYLYNNAKVYLDRKMDMVQKAIKNCSSHLNINDELVRWDNIKNTYGFKPYDLILFPPEKVFLPKWDDTPEIKPRKRNIPKKISLLFSPGEMPCF